ncbi:MAG: bacteriocin fulvocin C-related protein [Bacteroidetes bacterium]|nr:bacteriocin fulvocin C-related protein [Bacteroidota bacterium]
MKKLILSLAIFTLLMACSESEKREEGPANILGFSNESVTPASRTYLQNMSMEEVRNELRNLTPEGRYALWIDKMNHCLNSNLVADSVKNSINSLLPLLNTKIFDWTSSESDSFRLYTAVSWFNSNKDIIGNVLGTAIFLNLYDLDNQDPYIINGGNGSGGNNAPPCGCNRGSVFGACQFFGSYCAQSQCDGSSMGCGFMAIWPCDGMCEHDALNPNPDQGID